MPLDALCISAVREELSGQIVGTKIDKVLQPERDVLILNLRGRNEAFRLLISAGSADMRVHLTQHRSENPITPPMFCMLLRKHLTGARLLSISQPPAERILEFVLDAPDAFGVTSEKRLVVELIAKSTNIILVDNEGIIIDCLRRVGGDLSEKRSVQPGLKYKKPPVQEGKTDPLDLTTSQWDEIFASNKPESSVDKWLLSTFSALSPLICREIAWRAYGACDIKLNDICDGGAALKRELFSIALTARNSGFEPWSINDEHNRPRDFSYTQIMQHEGTLDVLRAESFSEMLDAHYTRAAQSERLRQRASSMTKTVKTARDRIQRKLITQKADLEKSAERDYLRECGDIITANFHLMKKGQLVLTAQDFFAEGERRIALDPLKTPQQNAAKYYKGYTKAKTAEKYLMQQVQSGTVEVEYLESVLEAIAMAESETDINEIRQELVQMGFVKEKSQKGAKVKKPSAALPLKFMSSTGMQILAGRNNIQNDNLTMKIAARSDIWLHAQKIHGAHVIISCGGSEPDETTLSEAAAIAAYYSSARLSGKVPVDFTSVRNVKKQPGGRPGMVTYSGFKTIIAIPDEATVERLRIYLK
ncbi:MAG: NFACT family protein [Oscillospiraceae bacterium]|nr:NFACT family protein [Oscillospiraceae bacterium]